MPFSRRSTPPLISIAVTTFNRWEGCRAAVEAIACEDYPEVEIIVIDDCSSLKPPTDILDFFQKKNVTFHRNEENKGLAAARNSAISRSRGRFFGFCDDDDIWPPEMLQVFVETCKNASDSFDVLLGFPKPLKRTVKTLRSQQSIRDLMLLGVTPPVASQIYRTDILRQIGCYRENVYSGVDHDLWISLAKTDSRVLMLFDIKPLVNSDLTAVRMTTQEEKRRKRLQHSLEVWKPEIVRVFGQSFFLHFYRSYECYLNYTFFKKALSKKDFLGALRRLYRTGVVSLLARDTFRKLKLLKYSGTFFPYPHHQNKCKQD